MKAVIVKPKMKNEAAFEMKALMAMATITKQKQSTCDVKRKQKTKMLSCECRRLIVVECFFLQIVRMGEMNAKRCIQCSFAFKCEKSNISSFSSRELFFLGVCFNCKIYIYINIKTCYL